VLSIEANLIFQLPIKGDLDRVLSNLMHDARHKLMAESNRIMGEAAKAGALQSNRVIATVVAFANQLHEAAMKEAASILFNFIQRMRVPPSEITGWARPHLQNLGNSLLGLIPPNGFPADHQRISAQYSAVFQQRLDGTLRDVEIGFIKGAGFTRAEQLENRQEWVTASESLHLLKAAFTAYESQMTICHRAHTGMIHARAERFIFGDKTYNDTDIPKEFWWAEGHQALSQNWTAGDFDTWTPDQQTRMQAFGVSFSRADIEKLIPDNRNLLQKGQAAPMRNANPSHKIFLVHGRDDAVKNEVALFLRKIGLEDIILHERPNGGRHLLTKFTEESEGAVFAVVLMTPDDVGGPAGGQIRSRARQNVVFELGFFIGKLGPGNVAALIKGDIEKPSDFDGIAYIPLNPEGTWKKELARELKHAQVPFDPAAVLTA
jgi:predicted nucleotide-binding protein